VSGLAPLTAGIVATLLTPVAICAALILARRAATIDPAQALHDA